MPADPAEVRLQRLLQIIPLACRDGGITIDELASQLGCEPSDVLSDLEEATAREYYWPAGTVDAFQIAVDGDRVQIWTTGQFRRPSRLAPLEALALGLALRALAAESTPERREEILALALRLERELTAPPIWEVAERMPAYDVRESRADYVSEMRARFAEPPAEYDAMVPPPPPPTVDDVLAEAVERHRRCAIVYLKPTDTVPSERTIAPYRLVYSAGHWYTIARDESRGSVRIFRLDRILEAHLTSERFEVPEDFDPRDYTTADGAPFAAAESATVRVRYSPVVARWVAEAVGVAPADDGTLVLEHPVADEDWLVRHVLRYAGEAEVVEPRELRGVVAAAARRMA